MELPVCYFHRCFFANMFVSYRDFLSQVASLLFPLQNPDNFKSFTPCQGFKVSRGEFDKLYWQVIRADSQDNIRGMFFL